METISVRVEKSGRILIPAAIRRRLNLKEGAEVLLHIEDGDIRVGTRAQALSRIHTRLRKYIPAGRVLSQELLEERREEGRRENP